MDFPKDLGFDREMASTDDPRNPRRDLVGDAAPIAIYVGDSLNHKPIEISADLLTSVKQIKDQLEPKTGVPYSECCLFWKGTLLEDTMILEDYKIEPGSVVDMLWSKAFKCSAIDRVATGAYADELKKHFEETWAGLVPARNFDEEVDKNEADGNAPEQPEDVTAGEKSRRNSRRQSRGKSSSPKAKARRKSGSTH